MNKNLQLVSTKDISELFGISYGTARKVLKKVIEEYRLEPNKQIKRGYIPAKFVYEYYNIEKETIQKND